MEYTNPIPLWRATTMRQITKRYTDSRGGRCAMGVLSIPKYANDDALDDEGRNFGLATPLPIVGMNDEDHMTFVEIANEVESNLELYFVPAACIQFQEDHALRDDQGKYHGRIGAASNYGARRG